MAAGPNGLDQSWGFADPQTAYRAGIRVVSMYLSHDPSKNISPAKVKAYHAAGIGVLLNWESMAGAPLNGAGQGTQDAGEAVRQANALTAAVGYRPKNVPALYFSCDADVAARQFPTIDAYYKAARAVCNPAGYHVGAYGEADLIDHLAVNGVTQAEWQTIAWSGGRVSTYADFFQSQINATLGGASVDFDRILHPWQLGAWWPPNSQYNGPKPQPVPVKPVPNTPTPTPETPVTKSDLPTTGPLATPFSNPDTGAKRSAAGWLIRIVQQLNQIGADVAAIRKMLEQKG